jgi:hypothetical protein
VAERCGAELQAIEAGHRHIVWNALSVVMRAVDGAHGGFIVGAEERSQPGVAGQELAIPLDPSTEREVAVGDSAGIERYSRGL